MPLTHQIIRAIVQEEIKTELKPINLKLTQIDQRFEQIDQRFEQIDQRFEQIDQRFSQLDNKLDKIYNIVVDLAGQFKRFDEEQTVLSGQVSDLTDRVEKLEVAVHLN